MVICNRRKRQILTVALVITFGVIIYYSDTIEHKEKIDNRKTYISEETAKVLDKAGDYKFYWEDEFNFVQIFNENKKYDLSVKKRMEGDDMCLLADDPLIEVSKTIKKIARGFVKEISIRNYKKMDGYEGYKYFSDELTEYLEKAKDPEATLRGNVNGKVIQTIRGPIRISVLFWSEYSADAFAYYEEEFISATDKWTDRNKITLGKPRNIFAIIRIIKNRDEKWEIDNFEFQVYEQE